MRINLGTALAFSGHNIAKSLQLFLISLHFVSSGENRPVLTDRLKSHSLLCQSPKTIFSQSLFFFRYLRNVVPNYSREQLCPKTVCSEDAVWLTGWLHWRLLTPLAIACLFFVFKRCFSWRENNWIALKVEFVVLYISTDEC